MVVSNNSNAYALERAKMNNIPTYIITGKSKEEIDIELECVLDNYKVDLIVLAGYLKLIGNRLISKYTIINTHPSLLPKFGGKGMYGMNVHKAVIEAKEKFSGPTVHFVNNNYDEGNTSISSSLSLYSWKWQMVGKGFYGVDEYEKCSAAFWGTQPTKSAIR